MRACFIAALLSIAAATAQAGTLADAQVGFSADRALTIDGRSFNGKMWTMPGMERHEQQIQSYRPIFLLRSDTPLGAIVLDQLHTIVEFAMPPELRIFGKPELKRTPIGEETVNGIATTKYAIDEKIPAGHAVGTLWLSRDGIPMRLAGTFEANNGKTAKVRWELSHVKIGPQPANLFEPPKGYAKLPAEAIAPLLGLRLKSAAK